MKNKFDSLIKYFVPMFLLLVILFSRSFIGIYIFGYRIGEYLVVFGLVISCFLPFLKKYFIKSIPKNLYYLNLMMVASFFVILVINQSSLFNTYIFKSSSYIWTISYIYVGAYFFDIFKFKEKFILFLQILLPALYVLQTTYLYKLSVIYPLVDSSEDLLLNFFINYSDKYEIYKGTDLLIFFAILTYIINRSNFTQYNKILYFSGISSLFIPLFMVRSRAAYFSIMLFIFYELFQLLKTIKLDIKLMLSILLIIFLMFNLSSANLTDKDFTSFDVSSSINDLSKVRNTDLDGSIISYRDGRLYSSDGNFNWRLQIWQDVFKDSINNNNFFFGYGYENKIPAMEIEGRSGSDGKNENVHNFIVNVYARGGIIQCAIYLSFIISIFSFSRNLNYPRKFSTLLFVSLLASLFDASMENAHFPVFLYLFIGYFIAYNKYYNESV